MWGLYSSFKTRPFKALFCPLTLAATFGAATCLTPPAFAQYTAAKTKEGIDRKAVITTFDAKLYNGPSGDAGNKVGVMEVFFILEGGSAGGKRTPVARTPEKSAPDGWLDNASFAVWDTLQMVDFAAQGGRKNAEIFDSSRCAVDFSRSGTSSICKPIGKEPERQQVQNSSYRMLVPVFKSEADGASVVYEGGFVRVTPGQVVTGVDPSKIPAEASGPKKTSGYDLVLVIDATASMGRYFRPTLDAVNDFVGQVAADLRQGEVKEAIRIGLLFYQDRKIGTECQLDYLTQWRVQLTQNAGDETIDAVKSALAKEHEATCGSDEPEEAVFDALNRALQDTDWKDGTFHVIALIGDADPHWDTSAPNYEKKNPMHFTVPAIQKIADEKNVRFIATRIVEPTESTSTFEALAVQRPQAQVGRFNRIPGDPAQVRQALAASLLKDWRDLVLTIRKLEEQNITQENIKSKLPGTGVTIDPRDYPIILNMLPASSASAGSQSYSNGWVPKKILDKDAVREFVFMTSVSINDLARVMDSIIEHVEAGQTQGGEAFVDALRDALATQLKLRPDEVFSSGETLDGILRKAKILPFDTGLLRFGPNEISQWRPEDYARVIKLLQDRTAALKDYIQQPGNLRMFSSAKYYYVPQDLFP